MDNKIQNLINNPDTPVSARDAIELLDKYPYFSLPGLLALKDNKNIADAERLRLAAHTAISLGSHDRLAQLLGDDAAVFENFYPEHTPVTPSTDDTLTTFLEKYGSGNDRETEILTEMIFNPSPSYESTMAKDTISPAATTTDTQSEQDRRIDSFISSQSPDQPLQESATTVEPAAPAVSTAEPAPKSREPHALTESLARVMIKNRNYAKALEIISELHLNNPEKSIYFADQIRFLRKLIINAKQK